MTYQKAVEFNEYFRCYVVGQQKVHIMPYDPRKPHHERYLQNPPAYDKKLLERVEGDALKLAEPSATTSTRSSSPSKTESPTPSTS